VLDIELWHREVLWIAGRQPGAGTDGRGGDQAVGLAEGDAAARMLSTPAPCPFSRGAVEGSQAHPAEETCDKRLLRGSAPTQHLLDVDRANPRGLARLTQGSHTLCGWTTVQRVDQDGRVEQQSQALTDSAGIGVPLRCHPAGRVRIPLVLSSREAPEAGFDVLPALLVLKGLANGLGDEHAAAPSPDAPVESLHEIAVESYVQTHGHNLAHGKGRQTTLIADQTATVPQMLIAIDGPAGAGKSTVARALAVRLGFTYLDSGAMYRCVGLLSLESPGQAPAALARAARIEPATAGSGRDGSPSRVLLDGRDVSEAIRTPEVSEAASRVAADPDVRETIVAKQRELIASGEWVAEGRDIGTVVAPDAELKVYLTADPAERARRRAVELGCDQATVMAEQTLRDQRDLTRAHSPLEAAPGALVLDTTGMRVEQVVERIAALAQAAGASV
jgi:cytidylate kinase